MVSRAVVCLEYVRESYAPPLIAAESNHSIKHYLDEVKSYFKFQFCFSVLFAACIYDIHDQKRNQMSQETKLIKSIYLYFALRSMTSTFETAENAKTKERTTRTTM
jgi:hypothetical protein